MVAKAAVERHQRTRTWNQQGNRCAFSGVLIVKVADAGRNSVFHRKEWRDGRIRSAPEGRVGAAARRASEAISGDDQLPQGEGGGGGRVSQCGGADRRLG